MNLVPEVRFNEEERRTAAIQPNTLVSATNAFRKSGVLLIRDVFDPQYISLLHAEYVRRNQSYFRDDLFDDALPVGNRRMMIGVEVSGIFNNPYLYAHSLILPIMTALVGPRCTLASFGSVISLPGADAQHMHRDHPPLFEDPTVDSAIPCFALTIIIPLIDMNANNGTTRVYPGSHRVEDKRLAEALGYVDPEVPIGSALIMDYLLRHGGTANRSLNVRPILYNIYARPWFHDCVNYSLHRPLMISEAEFERVPETLRPLFWAVAPHTPVTTGVPDHAPCPCWSGRRFGECHGKR